MNSHQRRKQQRQEHRRILEWCTQARVITLKGGTRFYSTRMHEVNSGTTTGRMPSNWTPPHHQLPIPRK